MEYPCKITITYWKNKAISVRAAARHSHQNRLANGLIFA